MNQQAEMLKLEETKKRYWAVLASGTRKSKRISKSVIEKEEQYWEQYDEDVVTAALQVHIKQYPKIKERYTRGIMRNMALAKREGKAFGLKQNKFTNFEQREYDFDALEKELLGE